MTRKIVIASRLSDYTVFFEDRHDFLSELKAKNAIWIIDRNVLRLYPGYFSDIPEGSLIDFDAVEPNKTLEAAVEIYRELISKSVKRNATLISVGGGITQDVSGFVASTLYRGIRWIYLPTTLLAQSDSCIGSKTSLNFDQFKNLIGTFYSPREVYINVEFLKTLEPRYFYSGFGEIIKLQLTPVISPERDLLAVVERLKRTGSFPLSSTDDLLSLIYDSLLIKKSYIEEDEFDQGRRNLLNYGHCLGHALESASGFEIPHGLAVMAGMLFANIVSCRRKWIDDKMLEFLTKSVFMPHLHFDLVDFRPEYFNPDVLIENMKKDKKRTGEGLALILPASDLELVRINNLSLDEARRGIKQLAETMK